MGNAPSGGSVVTSVFGESLDINRFSLAAISVVAVAGGCRVSVRLFFEALVANVLALATVAVDVQGLVFKGTFAVEEGFAVGLVAEGSVFEGSLSEGIFFMAVAVESFTFCKYGPE